jgi:hypothetical protein
VDPQLRARRARQPGGIAAAATLLTVIAGLGAWPACAELDDAPPDNETVASRAQAAITPAEPKNHAVDVKSTHLSAAFKARLEARVGATKAKEVLAKFDSYKYQPSDALPPPRPAGEKPVGNSHLADLRTVHERLQSAYGTTVVLSCDAPPCILQGDFDGDGKRDLAAQVGKGGTDERGVAVLITAGPTYVVGAGRGPVGAFGTNLVWLRHIRVEKDASSGRSQVVLDGLAASEHARIFLTNHKLEIAR